MFINRPDLFCYRCDDVSKCACETILEEKCETVIDKECTTTEEDRCITEIENGVEPNPEMECFSTLDREECVYILGLR